MTMTQSRNASAPDAAPAAALGDAAAQWGEAWERLAAGMTRMMQLQPRLEAPKRFDPMVVFEAVTDMTLGLVRQPSKLVELQMQAWQDFAKAWTAPMLAGDAAPAAPVLARNDRRFKDEEWEENPYYRGFRDNYLLVSRQLRTLVDESGEDDPSKRAIVGFLVEQYLNALAPTNFAFSNPVVMRRTVETGGANLVSGFANLLTDLSEGRGIVRRRAPDTFKVGENIAVTPGGVIFQNDIMQVIQYTPTTPDVHRRPMLYVAPLVNKYYMIDLQPRSSLIRWLVEQGQTVFVVSWVDPDDSHRHCEVDDYVGRGIIQAMDVVREATGEEDVDLFGFCMGGTLISMAAAVLAARGEADRIGSITLIGALVDFRDMRDWAGFINESHINSLDTHVSAKGYIDKDELQQLFSLMRANDLIWSSWVTHYLLDQEAPASDLLTWFEDGSHIPQAFLKSYNQKLLLENHLAVPGQVELLGERLDLSKITAPVTIIGLKDDHVSSWTMVYEGTRYFGGPVTFLLGGSGHNAGVINPPAANKHGFWTNPAIEPDADAWFKGAQRHEGSWWPTWVESLQQREDNGMVPARVVGGGKLEVLEPAPGSYVLAGKA